MNVLEHLFKFFPPPALLTMRHSGVALSDDAVRFIRFTEHGGHRKLDRFHSELLPEGIIKAGTIEKPEELIAVLKKIRKEFSIDFIAASIPDEKAYIFKSSITRQEGMNLSDVVAFKIQETVPISGINALSDFTIVGVTPQNVDVVVRVAHQKAVSAYTTVFEAAGMRPILFKVESQAVADAIFASEDLEPHIVVHMEAAKTLCMIVERRAVIFSIILDIGTSACLEALKKSFNIDTEAARAIIRGDKSKDPLTEHSHEDVFFAMANIVSVMRDQIIKLQEFWRGKENGANNISSLILCGFPAALDGFAHYLEMSTEITSKVANVWENAISLDHQVPTVPFSEALDYAPAIGLALPHKIHF